MNVVVYLVAGSAVTVGLLSVVTIVLFERRDRRDRDAMRLEVAAALDDLAEAVRLDPDKIRKLGDLADPREPSWNRDPEARRPSTDEIEQLGYDFRSRIAKVPLETYAGDLVVRSGVIGGLRLLHALETNARGEPR